MKNSIEELEYLGLLNRLSRDLENHLGVKDEVLAEFIIHLHRKSKTLETFRARLLENGAEFSHSLSQHLFSIIKENDPFQSKNLEQEIPQENLEDSKKLWETSSNQYYKPCETNQRKLQININEKCQKEERFATRFRKDYRNQRDNSYLNEEDKFKRENHQLENSGKKKKRLTSPERFEIKQLIAAGVASIKDYPELDYQEDERQQTIEEVEIEIVEDEPVFLKGKYEKIALEDRHDLKNIVTMTKNPEGSLSRTASASSAKLLELKEARKGRESTRSIEAGSVAPIIQKSIKEQRENLPIFKLKKELLEVISENPIVVVIGETGSGKTTQLTQYLYEAGYGQNMIIGCTQPRRVAAMSVAKRVSEEMDCKLGGLVGYNIRFEDCTSEETKIRYMTDGMLLRECLQDPLVSKYSVILLDEAHERTVNTDVLFGLLKEAVRQRNKGLKLIVTSATLDSGKFSSYFDNAPIYTIPGRTFHVDIKFEDRPVLNYIEACIATALQIHRQEGPGDILIFLTGQDEIDLVCDVLQEQDDKLLVLPAYAALPGDVQNRIFSPAPPEKRKVVVATNIAETSITIDGIYYVVDSGFCKLKTFNPKLGMDTLQVTPISQAQSRQRAGRAGRTGPGKCFRLYTQTAFDKEMPPSTIPEIQRTNLAVIVLTLKALGIDDLLQFDFMDAPSQATLLEAMRSLYNLGALDEDGFLTKIGRTLYEFPVEPAQAKMLLASWDLNCSEEILSIVSMLSVGNIFHRPSKEHQDRADRAHKRFQHVDGDHLTMLSVWESWIESGKSHEWCMVNFLHHRSLKRALEVKNQLGDILYRSIDQKPLQSEIFTNSNIAPNTNLDLSSRIRKTLCVGLFNHAARRDPQEGYKTVIDNQPVALHPSSVLFKGHTPTWVIYHELVMTSREYIRYVSAVDPRWLVEAAPTFFRAVGEGQLSKRQLDIRIVPLYKRNEKPDEWRISRQKQNVRKPVAP